MGNLKIQEDKSIKEYCFIITFKNIGMRIVKQ